MKTKDKTMTLDDIDLKILMILQADARQTYTAISKTLGLAHSTVYDRMKRMERLKIIRKYTTIVDIEKTGTRNITAIMTVYTDPKESDAVAERLCEAPEVMDLYTSLSEELLIIAKVVSESQERLHDFIADSVAPLPGVMRIRTSIITKKYKETLPSMSCDPKRLIPERKNNKIGEIES